MIAKRVRVAQPPEADLLCWPLLSILVTHGDGGTGAVAFSYEARVHARCSHVDNKPNVNGTRAGLGFLGGIIHDTRGCGTRET